MKNLQLTPPLLLITMGYPGAGKTYFARQFSELYNIPRLSEDVLRYELFEKPLFNQDETEIIQRINNYSLTQLMKTRQTVICEGNFLSLAHRKSIYELATIHGYRTLTIWLQTDIETSMQRAASRDRRNPDNRYSFPIDHHTFNKIVSTLERPIEKEQTIVISGKHSFQSQSLTVLRKITSMYSESIMTGNNGVINPLADPKRPTVKKGETSQHIIR